ncbi:periplasmic flagellar collar protein FlcA [Treponema berlinense]|uniref:periplasmic flagellar collar protein FlcA n=1 Tax=Treponema berlinense TaxID=225004 RepID=UPI003FD6DC49
MPGLNQLKKFASDMQNVGDEVKIRAQRGEKPAVVSLPEGISEADDSEDFVLGLPEKMDAAPEESESAVDSGEENNEQSLSSPTQENEAALDLDSLLNANASQSDDEPDLSEFLDEPEKKEPEEIPLEDLDLEALLKSAPEESVQSEAEQENVPFDEPASENLSEPDKNSDNFDSFEDRQMLNLPDDMDFGTDPDSSKNDDDFAFNGEAIDLNADLPEDIVEKDGFSPLPAGDSAQKEQNGLENAENLENTPDSSDFELDDKIKDIETPLDLSESQKTDKNFDENLNGGLNASPDDFSLPDFDSFSMESPENSDFSENSASLESSSTQTTEEENDTAAAEILKGLSGSVDASADVPAEDFSSSIEELGSDGNIDFGAGSVSFSGGDEFPETALPGIGKNLPDDDFLLDDDFKIPGFSDTQTAAFDKSGRPKVDVVDFSQAKNGRPKNTLTEEEYEVFRKNLSDYPLNLRLAIEDLVVKNEFTDDAVFEIIQKILNKAPARQIASQLEKMLDISIDVPRDYERRSFSQYEAYKQSFQYQLKNRIIPGTIAGIVIAFVVSLLFQAGVLFVYKPIMANIIYKQGYALLQNNEYPQSESKFIDAVQYKPVKKWFFKYAEGYREHKQFERAAQMYKNILGVFKHDKNAGLDWAEMELYDRANYERSEEIVRREILDWHINDSDGILLLGDVFLEWGETDFAKYEQARQTYSDLIQLYGATDLYMSRMLRYFIRTDKLKNVIELKSRFYPREKSLEARDWTELSGYLLDKLYGNLSRSDEYLRAKIEDVKAMLDIAEKKDSKNPLAHYNLARYFIRNSNFESARRKLLASLDCFDKLSIRTKKSVYSEIDACRLLGELYTGLSQYIKAQESYTRGIDLFQNENEKNGLEGDLNTGILYADMGDIEYFISGDMDAALKNYEHSVLNKNSTPTVNYRIGVINYNKQNYENALTFFIKALEKKDADQNLLLAAGNTLALRGDNFAAQGYYNRLLSLLNEEKAHHALLFPQAKEEDAQLVEMILKTNNNLGVVLNKIARQTGNSQMNGKSFECFVESIRAWDALTRNQETMVRLGGSNLALQNSKYISASMAEFEPAIYTDIPRTLVGEKVLK